MKKALLRCPTKYYGGKTRMLPQLLPMIPDHRIYIEAFAGGAALFWAKQPSKIEVLSDINGNVTNFYSVLKNNFSKLDELIQGTLHCEFTFNEAKNIYHNPDGHDNVIRAWAYFVSLNMSYGAEAAGSFQWVKNKTDDWHPAISIKNRRSQFSNYRNRLEKVSIMNRRAENMIRDRDNSDSFFYCDPPYVGARQGHYSGYTQEDFNTLISCLSGIKGMFLLSSYENEELNNRANVLGWNQKRIVQRLGIQSNNSQKTEVLTWNYDIKTAQLNS